MALARRDVGALTRALQRCLPRRVPSLERQLDAVGRRFLQLFLGRFVQVVVLEAVSTGAGDAGVASVSARACSGCEAARTTQPSDSRMWAWSVKRMGVACVEVMWGQGRRAKASKEDVKKASKEDSPLSAAADSGEKLWAALLTGILVCGSTLQRCQC